MAWLKKDTKLRGHPKLVACADALDLKPVYLEGHLDSIWLACLERYEDGDLSRLSNAEIAILSEYNPKNADCFVQLLQKHRWLEDHLIHDWLDYAGDYLKSKYRKSPDKLLAIYKKHGREDELKKLVHVRTRPVHVPDVYVTSQDKDKDITKFVCDRESSVEIFEGQFDERRTAVLSAWKERLSRAGLASAVTGRDKAAAGAAVAAIDAGDYSMEQLFAAMDNLFADPEWCRRYSLRGFVDDVPRWLNRKADDGNAERTNGKANFHARKRAGNAALAARYACLDDSGDSGGETGSGA